MKNLLLVDDNKLGLELLSEALYENCRHINILAAGNGLEGVKILDAMPVDFILTDLQMPVMDGFELAGFRQRHYPHIPLMAMTGDLSVEAIAKLRALRVHQFIAKPFDLGDVSHQIAKAMAAAPKEKPGYFYGRLPETVNFVQAEQ